VPQVLSVSASFKCSAIILGSNSPKSPPLSVPPARLMPKPFVGISTRPSPNLPVTSSSRVSIRLSIATSCSPRSILPSLAPPKKILPAPAIPSSAIHAITAWIPMFRCSFPR